MSKMILIIEDETSIQNIIKAFLEDAGYTVILAADGMEGIEQFRANKLTLCFRLNAPKLTALPCVRSCGKRAGFPSSCSPHWMMTTAR